MELVTGYKGEEHVTADQDADLYRGIAGTGILNVGNKMKPEISGSTLYIYDGVCIADGREIYIPYGSKDSISIPVETGSNTRTDLLVIEYSKQSNGIENAIFKLIQGTRNSGSDPPYTQADIRSGATLAQKPFCRLKITGSQISVEKLFEEIQTLESLEEYFSSLEESMKKCLIID